MIPEINAVVQRYPNLRLQVNKGERHRIIKNGVSRGSLWLAKQSERYRLKLTGDIAAALRGYVLAIAGDPAYADQGVDVWHLPFDGTMEKIIWKLAETDA
jgi:hypothetical protein